MILRQVFFMLISGSAAFANMRAPVFIDRVGTELRGEKAEIKVLSETLEFQCPDSYTGKPDFERFAAATCDARVRYKVAGGGTVKLEFVFSGSGNVRWRHNEKTFTSEPRRLKVTDRKLCSYCPDAMKNVMVATQVLELTAGENEIEVFYRQALSYQESGHSYFSDGKWTQGFTYELWPIAEWQWDDKFHAELKFSIGARSGFLGIGYKDDKMICQTEENQAAREIALTRRPVENDRRVAIAQVRLEKKTQRLRCSYGAD